MGAKCGDHQTLPLCGMCHTKRHWMGPRRFWDTHNMDPRIVIIDLLGEYLQGKG